MDQMSSIVMGALSVARSEAQAMRHGRLMPIHLLWGLYQSRGGLSSKLPPRSRE